MSKKLLSKDRRVNLLNEGGLRSSAINHTDLQSLIVSFSQFNYFTQSSQIPNQERVTMMKKIFQ